MFVQPHNVPLMRSTQPALAWKHLPRTAGLCLATLAVLVGIFLALQALTLTFTHNKGIMGRLNAAVQDGTLTPENFPRSPYGAHGLDYDMFTECLTMSINLGNENAPLLYRLAATPYTGRMEASPCGSLTHDVTVMKIELQQPYFRYWHGAQIYLRPLLANTSLANVHIMNALLLIAALASFAVVLGRAFGTTAVFILIASLAACTNILTTPASTVHALTWIWAFASLALMTHVMARQEINAPFPLTLVFGLGCIAAFFDVLFSPPFAPTLMAFLTIAFGLRRKSVAASLYEAALVGAFWFLGFSLSWASKWVFSALVLGWKEVWVNVLGTMGERSLHSLQIPPDMDKLFAASKVAFAVQNQDFIQYAGYISVVALAIAFFMDRDRQKMILRTVALLSPIAVPFVWIEFMRGHSIIHPQFAAISLVHLALLPLLAAHLQLSPHYGRLRTSVLRFIPPARLSMPDTLRR